MNGKLSFVDCLAARTRTLCHDTSGHGQGESTPNVAPASWSTCPKISCSNYFGSLMPRLAFFSDFFADREVRRSSLPAHSARLTAHASKSAHGARRTHLRSPVPALHRHRRAVSASDRLVHPCRHRTTRGAVCRLRGLGGRGSRRGGAVGASLKLHAHGAFLVGAGRGHIEEERNHRRDDSYGNPSGALHEPFCIR